MGAFTSVRPRLLSGDAVVAGVLSGTSADGIDVALVRFEPDPGLGPPRLLAFETRPFPDGLAARVRDLLDTGLDTGPVDTGPGGSFSLAEVATLSRDLGLAFGAAARRKAEQEGLALDLVGSHGQTVFHHDGDPALGPATMQLGEGAHVAAAAGAPAVTEFRQADLAAGGEGAPVTALTDEVLFPGLERPAAILNLGGIANLTLLGPEGVVAAFDTGPAGSLLDGLARRLFDRPYDRGGEVAARGRVNADWLGSLLAHPFFDRAPPKSTGRDTFGAPWVATLLDQARALELSRADALRTAVEAVAVSVAQALERFSDPVLRVVIVAGGGGRNRTLMEALERHCSGSVRSSRSQGVDPDAREAVAFAVLAARAVLGIPSTSPVVSGARSGVVLGALHPHRPFFPSPRSAPGPVLFEDT